MISNWEVIETNHMIEKENLDVRTITIGISLLDCIDSDLDKCNEKIYNKIMTLGERVIVISNHIKNHVLGNYKVDESKLRLVHRCVDIEKFNPELVSQQRIITMRSHR